jgi:hypothetical protein
LLSAGHLASDEEGSLYFGAAGYLFSKYGIGHQVMLPGSPENTMAGRSADG